MTPSFKEHWVPQPEWDVTYIGLMQAQQQLLIDFMRVAEPHVPMDFMVDCCRKFEDLQSDTLKALKPPTITEAE